MGHYDRDWMDCAWCGKWEEVDFHLDVDGVGVLCLNCYDHGPPHYEYLRGMLKNHIPPHLVIKVAAFAYLPCAITELALDIEDEFECDVCDESWLGWYCYQCHTTKT